MNLRTGAPAWSPALYRILGEDPAVAPSQDRWWARIHPEDRPAMQRDFGRVLQGALGSFQRQFRVVRADGSTRWVYGRGQVVLDASTAVAKLLGTVQDLTEHRALQEQLASAERVAAVGTLARGMAHEINNPLSYLVTNLRFLSRELEALVPALGPERGDELSAAVAEALHGADRVGAIVRDLMVFTRPETRGGAVQAERILDVAVTLTGRLLAKHARVVKDYAGIPQVQGDAWQLEQVFRDLLVNAALAIPEGRPAQEEIRLTTRFAGADHAAVEIRDSGAGMAPEVMRRIFEPFFTTRAEGAGKGLGLSTCLGIVRAAGGDIAVESAPGRGSTFTVTLPIAEAAPRPASVPGDG